MSESFRILVGLPAYNEEAVLEELLDDLHSTLEAAKLSHEVIVVDDGSTDRTAEILQSARARLPVWPVHHERNQNLGGAMRSLFRTALERGSDEDVLVCMDADNTFRPEQIEELVGCVTRGADLAVASRYAPGGGVVGVPGYRNLLSWGANRLFRSLFPIAGVSEYTCSFRGYRVSLLRRMAELHGDPWITEDGFTSMPEILIRLATLRPRTDEIAVRIRYDMKIGGSKMNVVRNVVQTMGLMRRLRAELRGAAVDSRGRQIPHVD